MIVELKNKEVEITFIKRPVMSKLYKEIREEIWTQELERAQKDKRPLWNGTVCTLNDIILQSDRLHLNISTCEYKDLTLRDKIGIDKLRAQFGENCAYPYINVQTFISDQNDVFLFGLFTSKKSDEILSVGGTLRTDDFTIRNIEDIRLYMVDEIKIETNIAEALESEIYVLSLDNNIATFVFKSKFNGFFEKDGKFLKRGEFNGEILIPKSKLLTHDESYNPRLKSIIQVIKLL